MATSKILDQYPQIAVFDVNGVAAGTGTVVQQLVTGLTNRQSVGWAINRIEYWIPEAWVKCLVAEKQYIQLGLTQNGSTTQVLGVKGQSVVDSFEVIRMNTPAAVGDMILKQPEAHVFPPGHEILITPQNLFGYLTWESANISAVAAYIRVQYKEVELGPENWYDLLQMRLPLGAT